MRDAASGHADGRELNQQAQPQEADQRKNLRSAFMPATGLACVLEDTAPFSSAPLEQDQIVGIALRSQTSAKPALSYDKLRMIKPSML